jgi:hypothetical protein
MHGQDLALAKQLVENGAPLAGLQPAFAQPGVRRTVPEQPDGTDPAQDTPRGISRVIRKRIGCIQ